jgi:hypothetical protein
MQRIFGGSWNKSARQKITFYFIRLPEHEKSENCIIICPVKPALDLQRLGFILLEWLQSRKIVGKVLSGSALSSVT